MAFESEELQSAKKRQAQARSNGSALVNFVLLPIFVLLVLVAAGHIRPLASKPVKEESTTSVSLSYSQKDKETNIKFEKLFADRELEDGKKFIVTLPPAPDKLDKKIEKPEDLPADAQWSAWILIPRDYRLATDPADKVLEQISGVSDRGDDIIRTWFNGPDDDQDFSIFKRMKKIRYRNLQNNSVDITFTLKK